MQPESAELWGKLAMNLAVHDFQSAAIPCYKRAAALDPIDFRWPFYLAIVLANTGSNEVLEWFDRCQNFNSKYAPLHILHGQTLLNGGQLDKAAKQFQAALKLEPANSHAAFGLARIYLNDNKIDLSRKYLLKAIESNPRHGEAYGLLAQVYRRLDRPDEAQQYLQNATAFPGPTLVSNPVYWEVIKEGVSAAWYQERGRIWLGRGDYVRAENEFRSALQLRPDASDHNSLGIVLKNLEKYDQAIIQFRSALAMNPDNPDLFINLATVYAGKAEYERALNMLRRADQLAKSKNRADLLERIKQMTETYEGKR